MFWEINKWKYIRQGNFNKYLFSVQFFKKKNQWFTCDIQGNQPYF